MTQIRQDFITVSKSAVALINHPTVAMKWGEPSALEDFSVGGLAAHLTNQIFHIAQAEPSSGGTPLSLVEYFGAASWVGRDASHEVNVGIRSRSEEAATDGVRSLADRVSVVLVQVESIVEAAPADRVVHLPSGDWNLTFDDFLTTRLLELVVHSDDLAVSVDLPTPPIPESAALTAIDLLSRLALRHHGATAVIRALSRRERAPATIAAL